MENITRSELRRLLAKRAGVTEKEAGLFVNAFINQTIEGLKQDRQVRINGLGTFRLQTTAPRKSVNVVTGESMEIESHSKMSFTPEATIKELVQSTGAGTNTEQSNPLQKLNEQAIEIVGILNDLGQTPHQKKEKAVKAPTSTAVQTEEEAEEPIATPVTAEEPIVEETIPTETSVEEQPEESKQEETEPIATEEVSSYKEEPQAETTENTAEEKEEKKAETTDDNKPEEKTYHPLRDGLITLAVIVVLMITAYLFLKHQIVNFADELLQKIHNTESLSKQTGTNEQNADEGSKESTISLQEAESAVEAAPAKTNATSATQSKKDNTETEPRKYTKFIKTEKLHADSRLAWVAYRYYGHKDLWVFIYEANKDHIKNPHDIKRGTPIRIPKLTAEQKDLNNPETRKLVDELIKKYE